MQNNFTLTLKYDWGKKKPTIAYKFMRILLKDIAEKLNLSQTTVSWVLIGKGDDRGISKTTQELVRKCAKEMNYQPNLIARSLNIGKSKTIGLIIPSISDFFYSSIARAIENNTSKQGYSLMIASSESDIHKEDNIIRTFRSKGVDGIILAPTKRSKVEIERLNKENFPLITFDRYFPELNMSYVIIDNKESSFKLVDHLIKQGKEKIAIITTNSYLTTMNLRTEGYKMAIEKAGLEINPHLIHNVTYENYEKNLVDILDTIFEKVPDVDGFFFATHILALEAFLYFYKKGIDFNNKFGLACIHSVATFEILSPNINVAEMPINDIGETVVNVLLGKIDSKNNTMEDNSLHKIVLPCTMYLKT